MSGRSNKPSPVLGLFGGIFSLPYNFLTGFFVGLVAPVAAIAVMVWGIRFLTGKVPFPGPIQENAEGERHVSLSLVSPEQVGDLYSHHKAQIGDELGELRTQMQAMIREGKARTQARA